ncbi:hypothetical protein Ccrd_022478 [Cynara cardunculus var. scolymus]|uniref:Uncharacterized protein n=1 Tax=Cynara cardunculus var. scolymus TaxID=59895 RepID=A0A124SE87_CYNCS|nr:hypothetical protein Ccrd_022478 [Cynara cardunculus var. scolymus]
MRPKYIAGPISSRSKARFIPHMGKRVPFGIVITASTNLATDAPSVPLTRLDKLSGGIIIGNVKPEAVRNGGRHSLTKTERVSTNKIRTFSIWIIEGVEEKRSRWRQERNREDTYKAIIVNGEDILLLGNHITEATTSRILKGDARRFRTENSVDIITIVEFIIETFGYFDDFRRIAILYDDQMVGLEEWPPHLEEIEVSDCGNDDVEFIFQQWCWRYRGSHCCCC